MPEYVFEKYQSKPESEAPAIIRRMFQVSASIPVRELQATSLLAAKQIMIHEDESQYSWHGTRSGEPNPKAHHLERGAGRSDENKYGHASSV